MALKQKREKAEATIPQQEPQYFRSATGDRAYNYNVYYMSKTEKILYFLLAFLVGAVVGFIFYGGIGKDQDGNATWITYALNTVISVCVGLIAGKLFLPMRQKQLLDGQKTKLRRQFRDMLEALATALGAGQNVTEAFNSVHQDLQNQYEQGSFILNELQLINSGLANGINIEDLLDSFGKRSGVGDIEDFANVFQVCYRKGGNIKETIRNTYEIINDNMSINEEIETIVSGTKNELGVMMVMPVVMVGVMKNISPDFASNFTSAAGLISTTVAAVIFVIAYFVGRKVLDIKV